MSHVAEVVEWDVVDGGMLGALIRCPDCPCLPGSGCDGQLVLHRPYRLPGGAMIDLHRDADVLVGVLDRHVGRSMDEPMGESPLSNADESTHGSRTVTPEDRANAVKHDIINSTSAVRITPGMRRPKRRKRGWRPWRIRSHEAHPWRRHRWALGKLASGLVVKECQRPGCDWYRAPW